MPAMRDLLDVVVIGAGHNGLTCACYLAAAGLKVHVVERRSVVGGAAVTEEFHPGFRNSTASYTVSLLNPKVIRDLRLAEHGLRIVERPFSNFVPLAAGQSLRFGGDLAMTQTEVARFSKRDAERLPAYFARLDRLADQLKQWVLQSPPELGGPLVVDGWRDLVAGAKLLLQFGRLPLRGQRDLVDVFTKSAGDWLDSWFESEPRRASSAGFRRRQLRQSVCRGLRLRAAASLLRRSERQGRQMGPDGWHGSDHAGDGRRGPHAESRSASMHRWPVLVESGVAVGVELTNGETLRARAVAANVDPKLLYQRLVATRAASAEFVEAIARYKCGSGSFRINVALSNCRTSAQHRGCRRSRITPAASSSALRLPTWTVPGTTPNPAAVRRFRSSRC
jgi:phytoene dehydrogenase-like protein